MKARLVKSSGDLYEIMEWNRETQNVDIIKFELSGEMLKVIIANGYITVFEGSIEDYCAMEGRSRFGFLDILNDMVKTINEE